MLAAMSPTIAEALKSTVSRLAGTTPSPQAEAEELLGRLLGLARAQLYLDRERALAPEQSAQLEVWVVRRLGGEPVQYVTGRAAFRGLDLAVSPAVLIPRPETELLVEAVLEVLRDERGRWPEPRVLDLGTGSGAIALAIATEWPRARVTATDLSDAALAVAGGNAATLGIADRVQLAAGHWFDAVDPDLRFEVVVANPPYIASAEAELLPDDVRAHEPGPALFSGASGLEALREIVELAPGHLVADGLLALELAEMRAREVAAWLEGDRDWGGVTLRDDLAGRPRILLARRQRGPAIAPAQWNEEG
jgi:release factor glutamine methyltransferase